MLIVTKKNMLYSYEDSGIDSLNIGDILDIIGYMLKDYQDTSSGLKELIIRGGTKDSAETLLEGMKRVNRMINTGEIKEGVEELLIKELNGIVKDYKMTLNLIKGLEKKDIENGSRKEDFDGASRIIDAMSFI